MLKKNGLSIRLSNVSPNFSETIVMPIIGMYIAYANQLMVNSYTRNRNTYKEICRHLQHAVKLGGHHRVEETIHVLRNEYKRCRALMEELNYIKL
jgi:phosphate/sulfate permease